MNKLPGGMCATGPGIPFAGPQLDSLQELPSVFIVDGEKDFSEKVHLLLTIFAMK